MTPFQFPFEVLQLFPSFLPLLFPNELLKPSELVVKQFLEVYPDLDNELNRRAWVDTLPRFAKRPAALDSSRYERFANFMKESGLIKETAPLSTYAIELK